MSCTLNLFLYRLRNLNWRELLSVLGPKHKIILRALVDEGGKLYPRNKPVRYDVVVDGVIGPDAASLIELDRVMRENFRGEILRLWSRLYGMLEVVIGDVIKQASEE